METYKIETEVGTLHVEAAGYVRTNDWIDFCDAQKRTILSVPTRRVLYFGLDSHTS